MIEVEVEIKIKIDHPDRHIIVVDEVVDKKHQDRSIGYRV